MKRLSLLALLLAFLTSCATPPRFTDNGKPGKIKVVVFYDDNKNGVMDAAETGAPSRVAVVQDVSCPPTSGEPKYSDTDASGVYVSQELKPGKYCVFPAGGLGGTTKLTQEVYVSSEQTTTVAFGVVKPEP